jgi:hypothetical protein
MEMLPASRNDLTREGLRAPTSRPAQHASSESEPANRLVSTLLSPTNELLDLPNERVFPRVTPVEKAVLGSPFVHPLNGRMKVEPFVESLTRSHDRVEQSRAAAPSGHETEHDRNNGKPERNEVFRPFEGKL